MSDANTDHVDATGPLTPFEPDIFKWDSEDAGDTEDLIHLHFESLCGQLDSWWEIAAEGRRLWNGMFQERFEEYSPADAVFSGVAAAAYDLALSSLCKSLGLDPQEARGKMERELRLGGHSI